MTQQLRMPAALVEEMIAHCQGARPNEACGILARDGQQIVKVFRMTNAESSPARYALDPKEQLAVYNSLAHNGWDLGGVFHSHTRTPAFPSPTDVRLATEDVPYVIVTLAKERPSIRAFRIVKRRVSDETGDIEEIPFVVTG